MGVFGRALCDVSALSECKKYVKLEVRQNEINQSVMKEICYQCWIVSYLFKQMNKLDL